MAQAGPGRLGPDALDEIDDILGTADDALARLFPGERGTRQPVHTCYVPADRFDADTVTQWGREALAAIDRHGGGAESLAAAVGMPQSSVRDTLPRVLAKLAMEPVEDLRVDFEDGYGTCEDDEEDAAAAAAAQALSGGGADGEPPTTRAPFVGIRIKSLEAATRRRGIRTLDVFLDALLKSAPFTPDLLVTLPKVTSVAQVEAMVRLCERAEKAYELPAGSLRFEIQVETPQAVLGPDGTALVAPMLHAAVGRCVGLHYGTYDYSASLGIAAAYQSMEHPVADHAKAVLQVAAAGTGVRLSDGSTNVLPVGLPAQVQAAWTLHARLVRRSLERGFYQGWDLHPAQLVTRYLATYAFFREGLPAAAARLRDYTAHTLGGVLDEPATARALASFILRGVECGAIDRAEATECSSCDLPTLHDYARWA